MNRKEDEDEQEEEEEIKKFFQIARNFGRLFPLLY